MQHVILHVGWILKEGLHRLGIIDIGLIIGLKLGGVRRHAGGPRRLQAVTDHGVIDQIKGRHLGKQGYLRKHPKFLLRSIRSCAGNAPAFSESMLDK